MKPGRRRGTRNRAGIPRDPHDLYPTPAYAVLALLDMVDFEGDVWDPACGDGELIIAARSRYRGPGRRWIATDLHDHGFGTPGRDLRSMPRGFRVHNVIANPPYDLINEALPVFLRAATRKVAVFAPTSLSQSGDRHAFFTMHPPTQKLDFSERVTMYSRRVQAEARSTGTRLGQASGGHSWYIWDKQAEAGPRDGTWLRFIPPGRKHVYGRITRLIREHLVTRYECRHDRRLPPGGCGDQAAQQDVAP